MTLNAYAVFAVWCCAIRAVLGGLVTVWAAAAARRWKSSGVEANRAALEDRYYLLFLLAIILLGMVCLAWPLYYLVLASYVPSWPGAMCIYGITQIGRGSLGSSRVLPSLVGALEVLKPAVVFVWGLWFITYFANRRTTTAPLTGRVFRLLALLGFFAVGEAVTESAWLLIPKQESFINSGCCTVAPQSRTVSASIAPMWKEPGATAAITVLHGGLVLALILAIGSAARGRSSMGEQGTWKRRAMQRALPAGALAVLASGIVFLGQTAAPWLMGLPHHRCLYCLLATRPETCVAVLALVFGCFMIGWAAALTHWTGQVASHRAAMIAWQDRLRDASRACLGGYALMISWQIVLERW